MTAPRLFAASLALLLAGLVLAGLDASRRRAAAARRATHTARVARAMPSPDLAVGGSSRHVRFLSLTEPGAFSADDVGAHDTEPTTLVFGAPGAAR